MACYHYRISGKVQGVFYRSSAQQKAQDLGLNGWVKNLANGEVECAASGDKQTLKLFQSWLKSGPPMAQVENLVVSESDEVLNTGFEIKY